MTLFRKNGGRNIKKPIWNWSTEQRHNRMSIHTHTHARTHTVYIYTYIYIYIYVPAWEGVHEEVVSLVHVETARPELNFQHYCDHVLSSPYYHYCCPHLRMRHQPSPLIRHSCCCCCCYTNIAWLHAKRKGGNFEKTP